MYRIDNKVNGFTEEKPSTRLRADWLNALQESLCKIIEEAGLKIDSPELYKVKPNPKIIYDAINKIIDKKIEAMESFSSGQLKLFDKTTGKTLCLYVMENGKLGFK